MLAQLNLAPNIDFDLDLVGIHDVDLLKTNLRGLRSLKVDPQTRQARAYSIEVAAIERHMVYCSGNSSSISLNEVHVNGRVPIDCQPSSRKGQIRSHLWGVPAPEGIAVEGDGFIWHSRLDVVVVKAIQTHNAHRSQINVLRKYRTRMPRMGSGRLQKLHSSRSSVLLVVASVLGASLVAGCATAEESTRLWIGPELVECEGVAPMMCMLVAESEDGEYEYFYDEIAGFDYQEGTSYVIDVEITEVEDPPADASSLQYTLVEIIEEN